MWTTVHLIHYTSTSVSKTFNSFLCIIPWKDYASRRFIRIDTKQMRSIRNINKSLWIRPVAVARVKRTYKKAKTTLLWQNGKSSKINSAGIHTKGKLGTESKQNLHLHTQMIRDVWTSLHPEIFHVLTLNCFAHCKKWATVHEEWMQPEHKRRTPGHSETNWEKSNAQL